MNAVSDESPIFVMGYMHSGTTLLQSLLGGNSAVYRGKKETRYFVQRKSLLRNYARLDDPAVAAAYVDDLEARISGEKSHSLIESNRRFLVSRAAAHLDHDRTFGEVFDLLARNAGCQRWLEKTPTHVFHVEEIARSFPNAKFVEIVRDCRDVLASKKTRRATVWTTERYAADQRQYKHWEKAFDPIWDTLSWRSAVSAGRAPARRHYGSWLTVRYEDLVANPPVEVGRICDFLGLTFEGDMLDVPIGIPADFEPSKKQNRGVRENSVGRYISVLSQGEAAACQRLAVRELKEHGYKLDRMSIPAQLRLPILLAAAAFELPRRIWRRYRLGGPRFALEVVRGYARRAWKLLDRGL